MKKIIIILLILIVFTVPLAYADQSMAVSFCNSEIKSNFHNSVEVQFPTAIISENNAFFFVHYKDSSKLITGGGSTRVDARCTIHKESYTITYLNIAGKDKTKPYDRSAI